MGKLYPWPRPPRCPKCCSGRLWGHGYVERYFEGFSQALWMKRYRCPDCGGVHTLRPKVFWRRFQCSAAIIIQSLKGKISGNRWLGQISRQAQQYWWCGFKRQCAREVRIGKPGVEVLDRLLEKGIIAATHSQQFFRMWDFREMSFVPAGYFYTGPKE